MARILESDSSSASNKYYKDVLPARILFYALPAPRPAASGSCAGERKRCSGRTRPRSFFPLVFQAAPPGPAVRGGGTPLLQPPTASPGQPRSFWGQILAERDISPPPVGSVRRGLTGMLSTSAGHPEGPFRTPRALFPVHFVSFAFWGIIPILRGVFESRDT